jgi:CarboxypepD_reg-like domain/Secretion system C-terminal sorting domain
MKQKIQLQIPEPCHENWNKMTATDKGRFCMSCQKEVIDFSVMSDIEILNYISTASKNICGHIQGNQLNRFIQPANETTQFSFKYLYSILITSFLISNKSQCQIRPLKNKVVSTFGIQTKKELSPVVDGGISLVIFDEPEYQINGRVVDENYNPISYASVSLKGTTLGIATDADGFFSLKTKENLNKVELIVSSVGFIAQTSEYKMPGISMNRSAGNGIIKMNAGDISLKAQVMDAIVITGYGTTKGKVSLSGAIAVIKKESLVDTFKNAAKNIVKELTGINEVKIYPNPVSKNSLFNISFNIKDPGQYNVQFTDASGRVVHTKGVDIISAKQVENFNSNEFVHSGVYFVTVRGQAKMYTSKLIVQ